MGAEIELKLRLSPEAMERFAEHALLAMLAVGKLATRDLSSTYYDTAEGLLRERRMALRVRAVGGRFIQTLKLPPAAAVKGGVQEFLEYEGELAGPVPDLALIDAPALQAFFAEVRLAERLVPIFRTEIERRTLDLRQGESEIELALDRGAVVAGERRLPICEAELELKSGRRARLYELALLVGEQVPFVLEQRSKAERGYGLLQEARPRPMKAAKTSVCPKMSVAEGFETLARDCLAQLRANEAAVLDGEDPEGVHQARVAVRRLRALLALFKGVVAEPAREEMREGLRWLQQQLGPARDWDVFLLETLPALRERLPSEGSLDEIATAAGEARERGYALARAVLESSSYARLLLRLYLWLEEGSWQAIPPAAGKAPTARPLVGLAAELLTKRARAVAELGGGGAALNEPELHALRIAGKKLRYAVEFFRGLYPKQEVAAYHRALVALQDCLGTLNDAVVAQRLMDELEASAEKGEGSPVPPYGLGLVIGWQQARIEACLKDFEDVWGGFLASEAFW